MSSKNRRLERILLSDKNIYGKIDNILEKNYRNNFNKMFDILLHATIDASPTDVNIILANICNITLMQEEDKSSIIEDAIDNSLEKLAKIKKNRKDINYEYIRSSLIILKKKIHYNRKNSLYRLYYSIIFENKDMEIVTSIVKNDQDILSVKDDYGNSLFNNILYKLLSLKDDDIYIDYYVNVILLFVRYYDNKLDMNFINILNENEDKLATKKLQEKIFELANINKDELKKKYNIFSNTDENIEKEVKQILKKEIDRVKIDTNFITIDSEDAKCLDDAISIVRNNDGSYTLYIAISDIPSVVDFQSLSYINAYNQGESLYLMDDVINMYHPIIANDISSLLPNENKNAIVYKFLVDPDFNVDIDSLEILKAVIKVKERLTYKDVDSQILSKETEKMINILHLITMKLRSQNKEKDKYRQIENMIDSDKEYHNSIHTSTSISANIVEESMLLINYAASRYFLNHNYIYLFRNHTILKDSVINDEIDKLLNMHYLNVSNEEKVRIYNILKYTYLNAYYSEVNKSHQGLNYSSYSHSSAAARRFSDSFNQYLTYFQVFNRIYKDDDYYQLQQLTKQVAKHLNERKRNTEKFASDYNKLVFKQRILERK